jgi:hypothetical protein
MEVSDVDQDDLTGAIPRLDDRSQQALTAASTWVGGDVQGVAIGATEDGEPCVTVYVLDTQSETVAGLPSHCEGLPVRVESGDAFTAGG